MNRIFVLGLAMASLFATEAIAGEGSRSFREVHRPAKNVQVGKASWYGKWHAGRLTANGERFDPNAMTCAHPTLPLGSVVKVTDIETGKNVSLIVNDRGPYVRGRIVDLSEGAAKELGFDEKGTTMVRVELLASGDSFQPG